MKQTLTLLILCFAVVANAQINFGVSFSEGIDKQFNSHYSFPISKGQPYYGVQGFYGFKKHRFSGSLGAYYSTFRQESTMTFTDIHGTPIGTDKSIWLTYGLTFPVELWISLNKKDARKKFGVHVGTFLYYIYGGKTFLKNEGDEYSFDYTDDYFYQGAQAGIFYLLNKEHKISPILNIGGSYIPSKKEGHWGYASVFLRTTILFGK